MVRSAGFVLAGFAVWMVAACSGDAAGGEETGSSPNTPGSSAGSGGGGSNPSQPAGSAGASSGNGGSSTSGARYSAREACERFAEASCNKGLECGLVLSQVLGQLICVQCSPAALNIIVDRCVSDGTTDKDAAAVDRCVANINAQPCAEACVDPSVDGCEVFGELEIGDNQIICDERCAE